MIVRPERVGDEAQIGALTARAFADMPYSDQTESLIVERLRRAGALTVSLVAEDDGVIVGHVAFSPVMLSSGQTNWYALGPISVDPVRQRSGIGSMLIAKGFARLQELGAAGCILAGDPAYYGRFGFRGVEGLSCDAVPSQYLLALPLNDEAPSGIVGFHPGFFGDAA
ncbi:N-acetyltransferase [Ciceribacter sp. L1K23]|uniref:GNAT family N-acetyltransferase n=1 Tax=unclassified Ciceribacter TaxID=2628820 RepID=UPI001ABDE4EF|nr:MULTISPECIES: N-acetyltransferase [unclassified Ciceribacter]MBO3760296.1 N-acetyltransferase [Ciceribacter sp. L1K22]MBR0555582.1 N-acetyltransferase [Ciceribacter sp. L1K23]